MDMRFGIRRSRNLKRSYQMSHIFNRVLDLSVSSAVLGLTLTIAGATVFLGA